MLYEVITENNIPFLGICLGLQCAAIEFARNVCNIKNANSSEFKKNRFSIIDLMADQKNIKDMGATMRLGAYPCDIKEGTKAMEAYNVITSYSIHYTKLYESSPPR